MPKVDQPANMDVDHGAILTIGIRCNGDRAEIVLPIATDATVDPKMFCENACDDADEVLLDVLAACLSSSAYISFVSAVGMCPGKVPNRIDFAPDSYPGTRPTICETSQVGALTVFYADPADLTQPGGRMRVAKNTIPGISDGDIEGDSISDGLKSFLTAWATILAEGWVQKDPSTSKWYRVLSAPSNTQPTNRLMRVGTWEVRTYTATQRRRLLPH